jgi:uncharacterized RDD family membrane protein YckC
LPPVAPEVSAAEQGKAKASAQGRIRTGGKRGNNSLTGFGQTVTLAAGEKADEVVAIMGSASSAGEVKRDVVAIMGNTRVTGGSAQSAVAVMGNVYVNAHVRNEVVAIMGNVELGPDAVVDGEIVCIGGQITRDAAAQTNGRVESIGGGAGHFSFGDMPVWFTECLLKGRLLAFDARVTWAWVVALGFLALYAFVALLTPKSVERCVRTLEESPGYSMLTALLALVLTPMAYLLLVITIIIVIGIVLIPVFSMGLFIAGLFGKIVILTWLGKRLTGAATEGPLSRPVVLVLVGGAAAMGLYAIPYAGFILYKLMGILGLGVVIYTLIQLSPRRKAAVPPPFAGGVASAVNPVGPTNPMSATASGSPVAGEATIPGAPMGAAYVPTLPPVLSAATLPRAGFWLRFAAAMLDVVMIAVLSSMLFWLGGGFPLWLAVYSVVMWATKGTTIGGIICGLKVVRVDDRPMDWSVAAVRGLGAFLSLAVAGLGFIWVVFDDEKQSWHDKIAGTTIVRVPRGTPLL